MKSSVNTLIHKPNDIHSFRDRIGIIYDMFSWIICPFQNLLFHYQLKSFMHLHRYSIVIFNSHIPMLRKWKKCFAEVFNISAGMLAMLCYIEVNPNTGYLPILNVYLNMILPFSIISLRIFYAPYRFLDETAYFNEFLMKLGYNLNVCTLWSQKSKNCPSATCLE